MRNFFKNWGWQEWSLLVAIFFVCILQHSQYSEFIQVPGPLYGGDLYFHYGHAVHLSEGGSVFTSNHYLGEYEHYPWLYHFIISSLAGILGASVMSVFIYFPIIITLLAGIIFYLLIHKITDSKTIALLTALLWMTIKIPSSHPTTFAVKVIFPLFLLSLLYTRSRNTKILTGIVYGVCGITHVTAFLGASLVIVLLFLYRTMKKDKGKKQKTDYAKRAKEQIIFFLPILAIGIVIAMLYWGPPVFVYGGETPNNWQEYASGSELNVPYLGETFARYFFNTSGILLFVISIISLFGLYTSIKHCKKFSFEILVFLAAIIGLLHPLITTPLMGTSFGFYRFPSIVLFPLSIILFGIGMLVISNSFKKQRKFVYAIIAVIILANFFTVYDAYGENQWTKAGKTLSPSAKAMFSASNFIMANTEVNDVFLSLNGESAFAVNALTGRKIMYMRATHASPYVDANRRKADAAAVLYGNNESLRNKLIQKYNLSYFFFDVFSSQATDSCLKAWDRLENPKYEGFSYYCIKTSPAYKEYLENQGIETKIIHTRLDPASKTAPEMDLLLIKPEDLKLNFTVLDGRQMNNQTAYLIGRIK